MKKKKLKTEASRFLDTLEESLKVAIDETRLNANIDKEKENEFYINSEISIVEAFQKFDVIKNANESFSKEPTISYSVNGLMDLFQKSAFTTGDIPHMNADTILSQQIVYQNINYYIPNTFLSAKKRRYLLRKDDLVKGIINLDLDFEKDIIVAMNLNIYGIKDFEKIESKIIRIPSTGLKNVIFVLPKSDLPIMKHRNLDIEEQKQHHLGILDDNRKVYASLIDLTDENNIEQREKWNKSGTDFTKNLKVQLTIAFMTEIVWKVQANVIQINIENSMEEQGIVNELSDIEKLVPKQEAND
ncbi:hypothetical protein JM79_0519 [Gramella sp. Hel_I_59]|uniref:hypothetical protein n=1 Tax=Gramella sp. Hel_I_59 TaxID=1249978 RepID=UPI001152B593|nr:hypothetical protein [Gramella sp. Hel_I_59]TQI69637.1 hypothetical protein JM79_0519 [Gramella sp. Hel_I_59]